MLWYLLYPLRGTTQPPRLAPNHPIRRAFYRHGKTTARHWLLAMLVSVAIAMGFSYPTIFLSESPTAGFAAYPHHVWTSAKPFEGNDSAIDVEMRQVWVHGSYMRALEKDVLKKALGIQEVLVGGEDLTSIFPRLDQKLRESTLSWGYHSPLMYWNSTAEMIDEDLDILATINSQSRTASSLNVALRPASVFAGKVFDRKRLRAADALVLTFMNKADDTAGARWQAKLRSLAQRGCSGCQLFPVDGSVTRNRVYEFSFTPLSLQENLALTFAYSMMALYVLISLRRLKAFHSRFGLVVTAITQMTWSILASFTICGILKINLSMIPKNAYPFVVLVIGLENMFRLINAVLAYPATMATDLRIANALGDIGPVSVATAGQNLVILALLASFVSPGVRAFCAFACIATLFDSFFLLTFFVAVLNVDIKRLELQDALARHRSHATGGNRNRRPTSPAQQHREHTWFDALVHGRLPFSTRMAGTAVTTTFVLSLNYHFFEHHEYARLSSPRALLSVLRSAAGHKSVAEFDTFTPPPMNASLTPGEWMRMQDFDTAREVMRLAKPGADSFVIRVFAPLIVVLDGSDRTGVPGGGTGEQWSAALRRFAVHNFYPVAVAVVFAVAFVAVLMNFLLYREVDEDGLADEQQDANEEPSVVVTEVRLPHRLDVVKLVSNRRGGFVGIALDRTISIGVWDRVAKRHNIYGVPHEVTTSLEWPIIEAALSDDGEYAAFRCADDNVAIYGVSSGMLIGETSPHPDENPTLLFEFQQLPGPGGLRWWFLVLTAGGHLLVRDLEHDAPATASLFESPLMGATVVTGGSGVCRLITVTERRKLAAYQWINGSFAFSSAVTLQSDTGNEQRMSVANILTTTDLGPEYLVVSGDGDVFVVDSTSLATVARLAQVLGPGAKLVLGPVSSCPICGGAALRSVGSMSSHGQDAFEVTSSNKGRGKASMCLRTPQQACRSLSDASRSFETINAGGEWDVVGSHAVVGIRRKPNDSSTITPAKGRNTSLSNTTRQRRRASMKLQSDRSRGAEWQAYKYTLDGELEVAVVPTNMEPEEDGALYVHKPGPTTVLDDYSIAVAFGNRVKIVRCSGKAIGGRRSSHELVLNGHGSLPSRRRLTLRKGL